MKERVRRETGTMSSLCTAGEDCVGLPEDMRSWAHQLAPNQALDDEASADGVLPMSPKPELFTGKGKGRARRTACRGRATRRSAEWCCDLQYTQRDRFATKEFKY